MRVELGGKIQYNKSVELEGVGLECVILWITPDL